MHPEGELLGVLVVAERDMLPVGVVDDATDGHALDVGEHLFAEFECEEAGAVAVVFAVGFGHDDELVAFSFWDRDFVGDCRPDDGAEWGGEGD